MKKLIGVYVSLFLIFSPAFAQTIISVNTPTKDIKGWTVTLSNGAIHSDVQFRELRGDYLDISEMGLPRTLDIGSIAYIRSTTKVKSHRGRGAKIGFITGLILGGYAGAFAEGTIIVIPIGGVLFGVILRLVGAGVGSFFKYAEEYDISDLSIDEKRAKIQKLMKKWHN